MRIPKDRRWQRFSRTSGGFGAWPVPHRRCWRALRGGVAADAEVEDRLVGPVDELGGRDAGAAHQVDDVGVGERLDVVDALLGEPGAVVEVDALELGQRAPARGAAAIFHDSRALRQLLPQPHEGALRHEPDEEHHTSAAGPV